MYILIFNIGSFCDTKFKGVETPILDEIKFYLNCFVQHKMVNFNRKSQKNSKLYEKTNKFPNKAKNLHNVLYKFSMKKLNAFFKIKALVLIFRNYMKEFSQRKERNEIFMNSENEYNSAMKLILLKIESELNA